jgi:hypothetical protein
VKVTCCVRERLCSANKEHTVNDSRDLSEQFICCYSSFFCYTICRRAFSDLQPEIPVECCSALPSYIPPSSPLVSASTTVRILPDSLTLLTTDITKQLGDKLGVVTKFYIALINSILTSIIIFKTFSCILSSFRFLLQRLFMWYSRILNVHV